MKWALGLSLCAALLAAGCSNTNITGDGTHQEAVYTGDLSIAGDDHEVTVQAGSDVNKISILGDGCRLKVADGAKVKKIEVAGDDNIVTVQAAVGMSIEYSEMGDNNRLIRQLGTPPSDVSSPPPAEEAPAE